MIPRLDVLHQEVDKLYAPGNPEADVWTVWGYPNHVLVVADLAGKIAITQGANVEFCVAGALLHDIADSVMPRGSDNHKAESLKMAARMLQETGFNAPETDFILHEIIEPHSCNDITPTKLEGKVLATADGAAHFLTDFFPYFCWQHYGPQGDYETFKAWALEKIEKHYTKKLFFDDIKQQVTPHYEALKLVFSTQRP